MHSDKEGTQISQFLSQSKTSTLSDIEKINQSIQDIRT